MNNDPVGCPHREDGYCVPCHNADKQRQRTLERALRSPEAFASWMASGQPRGEARKAWTTDFLREQGLL